MSPALLKQTPSFGNVSLTGGQTKTPVARSAALLASTLSNRGRICGLHET